MVIGGRRGSGNPADAYFAILNPSRGDILFTGTMGGDGKRIEGRLSGTGMEGVILALVRR